MELLLSRFAKEREAFFAYMDNKDLIDEKLKEGAQKARAVGSRVLKKMRQKAGYQPL